MLSSAGDLDLDDQLQQFETRPGQSASWDGSCVQGPRCAPGDDDGDDDDDNDTDDDDDDDDHDDNDDHPDTYSLSGVDCGTAPDAEKERNDDQECNNCLDSFKK